MLQNEPMRLRHIRDPRAIAQLVSGPAHSYSRTDHLV